MLDLTAKDKVFSFRDVWDEIARGRVKSLD